MRKIMSLIMLGLAAFTYAQSDRSHGWVYLNNGSIIEGEISRTDSKVVVSTANGTLFEYPLVEVMKISYQRPELPDVKRDKTLTDYSDSQNGFWMRARVAGSYTLFLTGTNAPFVDFDIAGGYMLNQYLKAGVGFGARYYCDNDKIRKNKVDLSFPIFATVTGNIIDDTYRSIVPYYSFDIGGAIRDSFMFRPTAGIRIGQRRSACLVGVTYTGQCLKYRTGKYRFASALGISVGYEF